MKIFVTGADGFLGSNLVRELLNRNYEVKALIQRNNDPLTIQDLDIEKMTGDLLNPDELHSAVQDCKIVIHLAANTSIWPPRSEIVKKTNIEGTQNIIDAVLEKHIEKLIYIGTANSFGSGTKKNPGNETKPFTAYKYGLDYINSKYAAHKLIQKSIKDNGLPATSINPTFMVGPFDSKPGSGSLLLATYQQKIPGYTNGGRNIVFVKDVAIAICNAITKGEIGECYITGNENLYYRDFFELIAKTLNVKTPSLKIPSSFMLAYGYLNSIWAKMTGMEPVLSYQAAKVSIDTHFYSSKKAIKTLDMPQTPIEKAIKEAFKWFKNNNYVQIKR